MFKKYESPHGTFLGWEDSETGTLYRRFIGGITWSGLTNVFVCVVGERAHGEVYPDFYPLEVLEEYNLDNLQDAVRLVGTLQSKYHLDGWVVDHENEKTEIAKLLREFARDQNIDLSLRQPAIEKGFRLALEVIRRRLCQDTLVWDRDGILDLQLQELNCGDPTEENLEDRYPEPFLLGALVHEFDMTRQTFGKKFRSPRPPSWMAA